MEGSCGLWVKCDTNDIIHHRRFYCTLDSKLFYLFHVWQSLDKWDKTGQHEAFCIWRASPTFMSAFMKFFSVKQHLYDTIHSHLDIFHYVVSSNTHYHFGRPMLLFIFEVQFLVPNQVRSVVFSLLNANQLWAEQGMTENIQHSTHLLSPSKHANNCWVTAAPLGCMRLFPPISSKNLNCTCYCYC